MNEARKKNRSDLFPLLFVASCYIAVALKFFGFISRYAVNLFITDQWDFHRATLFENHSLWEIFRWQHGPHRQGLGGVISKLIDPLFHWSSRVQSFEAGAVIFLASVLALYLKRRLFGQINYFDAAIPLLFLSRGQFETLIGATNLAHGPVPLLLLVLYCLGWTLEDARVRYACIIITNFLLIYTGFGLFAGFITPLLLLVEYMRLRHSSDGEARLCVIAFGLSILSLLSFFIGYRFDPAAGCFTSHLGNPLRYFEFVALMFANFLGVKGTTLPPALIGGLALTTLLVVLAYGVRQLARPFVLNRSTFLVVTALAAYTLFFCANAAIGRICLGLEAAQVSRYMIYLVPGFLALYFGASAVAIQGSRCLATSIVLLVVAWSSLHLHTWDWLTARNHSRDRGAWRECYLKSESIDQCTAMTGFEIHPSPEGTHLKEKLDFLKQERLNLYSEKR